MNFRLNPIAGAIASALFISTKAFAIGGIAGADGLNDASQPLVGAFSQGAAGTLGASVEGQPGENLPPQTVDIHADTASGPWLTITGTAGAEGGGANSGASGATGGGTGRGGNGGASVFGAFSAGGTAGYASKYDEVASAHGSKGGNLAGNTISLSHTVLNGGAGGPGGDNQPVSDGGGAGSGGAGGGSVFGGYSTGGSGGSSYAYGAIQIESAANGGAAGRVTGNTINLSHVTLNGAAAGAGGITYYGGAGLGGHGGGSVFGGISSGGTGGRASLQTLHGATDPDGTALGFASANGGNGAEVSGNRIHLAYATLNGGKGGDGGKGVSTIPPRSGAAGHGGGSVFGGLSEGGTAGYGGITLYTQKPQESASASSLSMNGGDGGNVTHNTITLSHTILNGAPGGVSQTGGPTSQGLEGGSVFGGYSRGGIGQIAKLLFRPNLTDTGFLPPITNGGNAGDVSHHHITIEGKSSISGNVYGGYSQGGAWGLLESNTGFTLGTAGMGGRAENNTLTLIGNQIDIKGAIYGGYSANGDGTLNPDKAFAGNTLNLQNYRGSVAGIYNFENYHWVLPKDEFNGDTLITITGKDKVQLDHTQHSVAMENDGNRLNAGDQITLIDKAQGAPTLTTPTIEQGHFITYDTTLAVTPDDKLVLRIAGKDDTTPQPEPEPKPEPTPAGRVTPTAKAFLEGRLASLAQVNQGADAISGIGLDAARNSVGRCGANLFMFIDGGSNRYETGSHIKLRNTNFGFGAANCFALQSQSQVLLGAFVEHGNGNYDSYNQFEGYDDVHGWGKVRYTGAGVLMHMNVAGTGSAKKEDAPSSIARNDGLYLDAAIRAGKAKTRFDSNLVDPEGLKGSYNAKSTYYSVMAGAGYALPVDEKQTVDLYSRFTWSHINADTVTVGKDTLHLGKLNSSRLRLGARYSYAATPQVTPYVGLAYEREFSGKAKGSAYGMDIDSPTLKGNTGIAELGLTVIPQAAKQALSVNFGVKGFFSNRKGGAANLRVRYAF